MAGNTFGQIFTVTTFGESHGALPLPLSAKATAQAWAASLTAARPD